VRVTALVAALDERDRVGDTVRALRSVDGVDEVVVVDGGSADGTAAVASTAGALVLVAPARVGKGDAIEAALALVGPADVFVLADADLGRSAAAIAPLLDEVRAGRADMAVAVLPAPPTGGFGLVKRTAGALLRKLTGLELQEPLSGQRVVTGRCLQACRPIAPGIGAEVGLTSDAVRLGFHVVEIPAPIEHRFTRKDPAGFLHRGRQGVDALRAGIPRLLRLR